MFRWHWLGFGGLACSAALIAAAVAGPPSANAEPRRITPTSGEAAVREYLPIARSYWPGSRCAGREQITLVRDLRRDTDALKADGLAIDVPGCRVSIDANLVGLRLCYVLAHELGHLAGAEDNADPASIMHATGPAQATSAPCDTSAPTKRTALYVQILTNLRTASLDCVADLRQAPYRADCTKAGSAKTRRWCLTVWADSSMSIDGTALVSNRRSLPTCRQLAMSNDNPSK
jgi:hypothetical protein